MDKIASFTVDHLTLEPGLYVSRIDRDPATAAAVTTFDIRVTAPNREPVMNTAEVHTIEHLGATYVRNDAAWASRVVYFGPMGCRTGFYLVVFGEVGSREVLPLVPRRAPGGVRQLPRPESCRGPVVGAPVPRRARRHRRAASHIRRLSAHGGGNPRVFRGSLILVHGLRRVL